MNMFGPLAKKTALPKILLPFLQTYTKIALIPCPLPLGIFECLFVVC